MKIKEMLVQLRQLKKMNAPYSKCKMKSINGVMIDELCNVLEVANMVIKQGFVIDGSYINGYDDKEFLCDIADSKFIERWEKIEK